MTQTEAVDAAIRRRRTLKVLADPEAPLPVREDVRPLVEALAAAGGRAPFHRVADASHRAGALPSYVPWRFHALDGRACRALLARLRRDDAVRGKIPGLLAAADALVLATWLPDPGGSAGDGLFEASIENMEHVAAAGAAVQNLLVAASARGCETYWSSGGVLRTPYVFDALEIPAREILLGAVFISLDVPEGATALTSKLADRRGPTTTWMRWAGLTG